MKQLKTIESLPNNGYNLAKSMRKNGYAPSSCVSGEARSHLLKHTRKIDFFSEEAIKRDIAQTRKLAIKKEDITNLNRIDEHRAKIAGIIVDKSEVDNKNPDKVIISYGNKEVTTPPAIK